MLSKLTKKSFTRLCHQICKSCKIDCCNLFSPYISEHDKKRINKIIKSKNLFNGNHFNTKDKSCPFYDIKQKECTMHEYRPMDCQIYPYSFWFEFGKLELWLDPKCQLSKHLVNNKAFYKEAMAIAKKELAHWSEGEIYAYLMSEFDINKFKKQVGKKKMKYFKN